MSLRFGHNPRPLGEVQNIRINGLACLGKYCIYLGFETHRSTVEKGQKATLEQLSCHIEIPGQGILAFGEKTDTPIVEWNEHYTTPHFGFKFILSSSQIEAIEKIREAGDLKIDIWLAGVTKSNFQENSDPFHDRASFNIPKQEWLEALSSAGYKNTLLFELSLPHDIELSDAIKKLINKSQSHILNGHYDESVALCRQVIEHIEATYEDKKEADKVVDKFARGRKSMTINERMLFARQALKHITHLANHPNNETFSRSQAKAILGSVIAFLSSNEPIMAD